MLRDLLILAVIVALFIGALLWLRHEAPTWIVHRP